MSRANPPQTSDCRLALVVRGVVQGVGFRPFVYRAARSMGLAGWVRNEADAVRIEVQGDSARVDRFVETLRHGHPPQARIDRLETRPIPCEGDSHPTFEIISSTGRAAPRPTIPADLATCAACLDEIHTPGERRRGYPFTNCTACGPRWSIIRRLPYDRPDTAMARFAMCDSCRAEYENPADRRFHAQPIACPACGPVLRLLGLDGGETATGEAALTEAADVLRGGRILAMKGLGGFQLLVDATDTEAVERLRRRKRRPHRPFAVMLRWLADVEARCRVSPAEAAALTSPEAPIVLLRRRPDAAGRADVVEPVAPGNPWLGVLLPYTPLHHLIAEAVDRPLVCTSGNLSDEPMAITTADAMDRLGTIADAILTHNRPIVRPVDDSVVRIDAEGLQVLRRARGFAPLPVAFEINTPTIVAFGGHLKNTVALALGECLETENDCTIPLSPWERAAAQRPGEGIVSQGDGLFRLPFPHGCPHPNPLPKGEGTIFKHIPISLSAGSPSTTQVILSPHVGDLDTVESVEVHRRAVRDLVDFFEATPEAAVCDEHPDYASTREAEKMAAAWGVPLLRVQHHHAHVVACAAEHGLRGPVLGLAWDGTGFGPDGTVWGGEALVCEGADYERIAHLRPFGLPGGDKAARQPRRSALGLLYDIFGPGAAHYSADWFRAKELDAMLSLLDRNLHAPRTSSMGRLYDAVSMLCGLAGDITFEGQAAMALEFAAEEYVEENDPRTESHEDDAYPLPLSDGAPAVADWEPTVRSILGDLEEGTPVGRIALRFHNALAELAVAVAQRCGCSQIALTGGCFQNALLTDGVRTRLHQSGFSVYTHRKAPPGDGGIALGQIAVAARRMERVTRRPGRDPA